MGHAISGGCCRDENQLERWDAELQMARGVDFNNERSYVVAEDEPGAKAIIPVYADFRSSAAASRQHSARPHSARPHSARPHSGEQRWCCKVDGELGPILDGVTDPPEQIEPLESLSYTPVRFDESTTIDVERSHARYSKIVVHSTRARTQRRSKVWEDWLKGATAGRTVVLITGIQDSEQNTGPSIEKVPAMYYLDRSLSKLSILPANGVNARPLHILVNNIHVICAASDFMLFCDEVDDHLDDTEKARAVFLQYVTEDTERKRVCFLEDSEPARERFVQALTQLWLERRNDHSMWF